MSMKATYKSTVEKEHRLGVATSEHVKVIIRCRPLDTHTETDSKGIFDVLPDVSSIHINCPKFGLKKYHFTCVADQSKDQAFIFEQAGLPIVDAALAGFNGAIIAYGQTGSGKTYTMQGPSLQSSVSNQCPEQRGITQAVCERIFHHTQATNSASSKDDHPQFSVTASYLEIYNEKLIDLLTTAPVTSSPSNKSPRLSIREHFTGLISVNGLTSVQVRSPDECYHVLLKGAQNRSVADTHMNSASSRSHAVFTLAIEKNDSEKKVRTISRLHLVDLAGSERQKGTGATGIRLKEAGGINKSLSALGNVINSLSANEINKKGKVTSRSHTPSYRDSKLTFLLKDSLGGNSKLCLIATISLAMNSLEETTSTLDFAKRCSSVRNEAVVNESLTEDVTALQNLVLSLQEEMKHLQATIAKSKATEAELKCINNVTTSEGVEPATYDNGITRQGKENICIEPVSTSSCKGQIERKRQSESIDILCILLTNALSRERAHKRKKEQMKITAEGTNQKWIQMVRTNEELVVFLKEREDQLVKYQHQCLNGMGHGDAEKLRRELEALKVRIENNSEVVVLRHRVAALESELKRPAITGMSLEPTPTAMTKKESGNSSEKSCMKDNPSQEFQECQSISSSSRISEENCLLHSDHDESSKREYGSGSEDMDKREWNIKLDLPELLQSSKLPYALESLRTSVQALKNSI